MRRDTRSVPRHPTCLIADPDLTFCLDADPDPDPILKLSKVKGTKLAANLAIKAFLSFSKEMRNYLCMS
jgi:hypothetical protein